MNYHKVTASQIDYFKNASTAIQAQWFYKLKKKLRLTAQNIWFNQQCLKRNLTPTHIHIQIRATSTAARRTIEKARRTWLKEEVRSLYHKRNIIAHYIKVLHSELSFRLHPVYFDLLVDKIMDNISSIIHKKFLKQQTKLEKLSSKIPCNVSEKQTRQNHNNFINYSNIIFTQREEEILGKGPKFAPRIENKLAKEILISELEANKRYNQVQYSSEKLVKILNNQNIENNLDKNFVKSIKTKIKNNNLTVTKADKSNAIIILPKTDYVEKVLKSIDSNMIEVESDPLIKHQKIIKKFLKDSVSINDKEKSKLTKMNPSTPTLYGLIKTHKKDAPIRPVVSHCNSPSRNLAIYINERFNNITKFQATHSIKNSIELVNKLKSTQIPNSAMLVSFDVSNMFPNIPTTECLELLNNLINKSNTNFIEKTELMEAFNICINQTQCKFNNKFYQQTSGLAMGSPISPLLANIFMDNLETLILSSPQGKKHINFWHRYVDDILACFTGTKRQLELFLQYLNNLHPTIKFTLETEQNKQINFLDLTIIRNNGDLKFKIYRKPTFSPISIDSKSQHPLRHKLANYNSMIHRAFSIPLSDDDLEKELNYIKYIAEVNGFSRNIISKLIAKKEQKIAFNKIYPVLKNHTEKYISLTYFGKITEQIANSLRNVKIAFKQPSKLSNLIFNAKDKPESQKLAGVYRLECQDCDAFYIGQTGRPFEKRYEEHLKSYELVNTKSTFANHCINNNHKFPEITDLKILYRQDKGNKLNYLESMEIYKQRNNPNILNEQVDLIFSPLFKAL